MFLPDRIDEASIICLKKDFDLALQAVNDFGNFHLKEIKKNSKKEHYEQLITRTEEIMRTLNTLMSQLKVEENDFLAIFKADKRVRIELKAENWQSLLTTIDKLSSNLKTEVDNLETALNDYSDELSNLQNLQQVLLLLDRYKINPELLQELQFLYVVVAVTPSRHMYELGKALASYLGIFYHDSITKDRTFVFYATSVKYKDQIQQILKDHYADIFNIPVTLPRSLAGALEKTSNNLKEIARNKEETLNSLRTLAKNNASNLFAFQETAQNILNVLNARHKSVETEHLVTIRGYIPATEYNNLSRHIDSTLNTQIVLRENTDSTYQDPPTRIHNPFFIKPFEIITTLYGFPKYNEVDPTILLAITFPLIFGLMFADLGHGLILLTCGVGFGLSIKRNEGLRNFSWILAICGIGAIFAGLLFGEFFGKHLLSPLWFDPFEDITAFLILSLFVGIIQIMSGFILDFINLLVKGNVIDAFLTSLPKTLFYLGAIYLILVYQLNIQLWFQGPILLLIAPIIFMILGKFFIIKILQILGHPIEKAQIHDSLLERLFESGDLITRLLSNTMSYTRILALLMAHWALLLVTYTISDMIAQLPDVGFILSPVIIVGGNIFVMGFEGLIVFIHTLRLHFYEWFSKFYQGTGIKFTPLKQSHRYAKIIFAR